MQRVVTLCFTTLLLFTATVRAADSSATTMLSHMADCIHRAGDMKGAKRDAFMSICTSAKPIPAVTKADKTTAPTAVPIAAKPVVADSNGSLPAQERILGCATATKGMKGEERSKVLKDCLAGNNQSPDPNAPIAQHESTCATQAKSQPAAEREAFLKACLADQAAADKRNETRRLAACNVKALDQNGAQRKAFIKACLAGTSAAASSAAPHAVSHENLTKRCADETLASGEGMAHMTNCVSGH